MQNFMTDYFMINLGYSLNNFLTKSKYSLQDRLKVYVIQAIQSIADRSIRYPSLGSQLWTSLIIRRSKWASLIKGHND